MSLGRLRTFSLILAGVTLVAIVVWEYTAVYRLREALSKLVALEAARAKYSRTVGESVAAIRGVRELLQRQRDRENGLYQGGVELSPEATRERATTIDRHVKEMRAAEETQRSFEAAEAEALRAVEAASEAFLRSASP